MCVGGASNLTGTINDVRTICARAREVGAMTYIDAVQSVPHVATDVQQLGCDFLVCSAYKFFGPHQGILWGRRDLLESLEPYKVRPAPDAIPGCFETGTQSHEDFAGVAAAVDYFAWIGETMAQDYWSRWSQFSGRRQKLHAAMDFLFDYERTLADHLVDGLDATGWRHSAGNNIGRRDASSCPDGRIYARHHAPPKLLRNHSQRKNIFVWSGHNYAVEVAKTLGIYDTGGAVRVGPVHYNSHDEIDELLAALARIIGA